MKQTREHRSPLDDRLAPVVSRDPEAPAQERREDLALEERVLDDGGHLVRGDAPVPDARARGEVDLRPRSELKISRE